MATPYSMEAGVDGWVTLTLIPPVMRLKCIVWVLSLFFGKHRCSDMAGIGYTGPGPRMGPIDNLSLVTGPANCHIILWYMHTVTLTPPSEYVDELRCTRVVLRCHAGLFLFLPSALAEKVKQSVASACFHSIFWTDSPLNLSLCVLDPKPQLTAVLKVVWKSWGAPSHLFAFFPYTLPQSTTPIPLSWVGWAKSWGAEPPRAPLTLSPG